MSMQVLINNTIEWLNMPSAWSVQSDLTKLLDLYRNKYIGLQCLLPYNENEPRNKVPFNNQLIESVNDCMEYLVNNIKPCSELNDVIKQYIIACESISK